MVEIPPAPATLPHIVVVVTVGGQLLRTGLKGLVYGFQPGGEMVVNDGVVQRIGNNDRQPRQQDIAAGGFCDRGLAVFGGLP